MAGATGIDVAPSRLKKPSGPTFGFAVCANPVGGERIIQGGIGGGISGVLALIRAKMVGFWDKIGRIGSQIRLAVGGAADKLFPFLNSQVMCLYLNGPT